MLRTRLLTFLSVTGATLGFASLAFAQSTCETDNDCGHGNLCQITAVGACAVAPCAPNGNCPTVTCDPVEYRSCVPGPCITDSDCGSGMACNTVVAGTTTQGATAPAGKPATTAPGPGAPVPEALPAPKPTATATAPAQDRAPMGMCTSRVGLECKSASDCGKGFDCTPQTMCSCSGGAAPAGTASAGSGTGGTPATDAAAPLPPVTGDKLVAPRPPDTGTGTGSGGSGTAPPSKDPQPDPTQCSCSAGPSVCVTQQILCNSATECPADWSCSAGVNSVSVASPPIATPTVAPGTATPGAAMSAAAPPVQGTEPSPPIETTGAAAPPIMTNKPSSTAPGDAKRPAPEASDLPVPTATSQANIAPPAMTIDSGPRPAGVCIPPGTDVGYVTGNPSSGGAPGTVDAPTAPGTPARDPLPTVPPSKGAAGESAPTAAPGGTTAAGATPPATSSSAAAAEPLNGVDTKDSGASCDIAAGSTSSRSNLTWLLAAGAAMVGLRRAKSAVRGA